MADHTGGRKTFRLLLALLLSFLAAGLALAVLALPDRGPGLAAMVAAHLADSGVSNPVTAVLLNFRGYDTLLEMGVLLLALVGTWSLAGEGYPREPLAGPVLDLLVRLLVPLMILVAGYLLWIGAHAPGGAFQAGSVLGAAGVLLILAGRHPGGPLAGAALRVALAAGLVVFLLVALAAPPAGRYLLQYPPGSAGGLILLIETAATLSIGCTLAALFLGKRPATTVPKP